MALEWILDYRRRALLAHPFPADWDEYLDRNVQFCAHLPPDDRSRLRDILRVLVAEKFWEGAGGLEMSDEIKVTIAAQAALLLVGIPHDFYPNVESVIVYPTAYSVPANHYTSMFQVLPPTIQTDSASHRLGESWSREGPVIVSWADALAGGTGQSGGRNVVFHEFAHKLDLRDDRADGVPRLTSQQQYDNWAQVMSAEYQALAADVAGGHASLLDPYGLTDAGEFFAVATECFFEKARPMRQSHQRLYEALSGFYHQDPAGWT